MSFPEPLNTIDITAVILYGNLFIGHRVLEKQPHSIPFLVLSLHLSRNAPVPFFMCGNTRVAPGEGQEIEDEGGVKSDLRLGPRPTCFLGKAKQAKEGGGKLAFLLRPKASFNCQFDFFFVKGVFYVSGAL